MPRLMPLLARPEQTHEGHAVSLLSQVPAM
ncbi:MAG: hypothetical protein QOF76_1318 [Solirubrobacteraceae bacterium]|nr:hypothetical protein [Solirubrobacteraceae bacterium]